MGERKVLNKYYPPDFDPSKLPRNKKPKTNEMKVRMMLPMSVRCKTCGNFMYKGTKFNTRKEDVLGETYLGIQLIRFYYRCTQCAAEFTMVTDPQNSDYKLEHGASRNYEPWRATDVAKVDEERKKVEEEEGNVMKALENKTIERKRELDIMAALDEMKSLKARHGQVTTEQALQALMQEGQKDAEVAERLPEEDEAAIRSFMQQQQQHLVKRLDSDSDENGEGEADRAGPSMSKPSLPVGDPLTASTAQPPAQAAPKPALPVKVKFVPKKKQASTEVALELAPAEGSSPPPGLLGLGEYSSDSQSS